MSEREPLRRDAITRAWFFLEQARGLPYRADIAEYEPFEAYLEATIIYSRVAVHRLHREALQRAKGDPRLKAEVVAWWASLRARVLPHRAAHAGVDELRRALDRRLRRAHRADRRCLEEHERPARR